MNDMNFGRNAAPLHSSTLTEAPTSPASGSDQGSVLNLKQYLTIARRRKWPILLTLFAALLAGVVITLMMTPLYTATATVEIKRENMNITRVEGLEPDNSLADPEFYQTQYGLLRANSLAERVALDLKLADSAEFFEMYGASEAAAWFSDGALVPGASTRELRVQRAGEILLDNISVDPVRMSSLVNIGFTSPDPLLAAKVVNAWTSHFIESTLERRFEATSYARVFLEERLEQLRARLDESERLQVAYAARQGIIKLPGSGGTEEGERSIVADDLAALNRELAEATADRVRAQSRLGITGANTAEGLANQAIGGMRQRRAELASEYARLLVQFEPEYPAVVAIQQQIEALDRAIGREEGRVQSTLRETYEASAAREAALKRRVEALKGDLLDLRRRSIQYNIYQRDVDTNRELYDGLLQRYKEIGVAGGVGVNNIAIVDRAKVPSQPTSPNLLLNLLIALGAGLVLGAALAFALEQIDEAFADPDEVEKMLGIPVLGSIPKVSDENPEAALEDRKSPIAEAYLAVQTNLAFSTDHGVPRTLAITSTRPAEGKSTTAYAIASTLARTGRKVLLVDTDMRSPSAHNFFGITNERGLSNYLAGGDEWKDLIRSTDQGFSVMTAGPQPPSAAELLTSNRLTQLLTELMLHFDHIVADAPPVMGLADAPLIGSQVEGSIFVVESHGTRSGMARLALRRLRSAQVHVVGAVVTKHDVKRAAYGYGYDYGYGYGQSHSAPSEA